MAGFSKLSPSGALEQNLRPAIGCVHMQNPVASTGHYAMR